MYTFREIPSVTAVAFILLTSACASNQAGPLVEPAGREEETKAA